MLKKLMSVVLVLVLVLSLGACGPKDEPTPTPEPEKISVIMITDTGGLGDESFNDSAYAGLTKAEEELGIEITVMQSQTADDYGPNLSAAAEEGADLIISVGFLMQTATAEAAAQFSEQNFAIIDENVDAANVAAYTYREEEGSFLVGVIAGLTTESDVIGFVGGMAFPLIEKFEYGFKAGVKAVNPDAEVVVNYTGSFEDSQLGKETALVQNQLGADVIYHASGGCGIGVIEAAGSQDFWAIGVDMDQSSLDPEHVLASMIKRVDVGTYLATESVVEGTYDGSAYSLGLAEEGVGYSDEAGNLTQDLIDAAEMYKEAIVNGDIMVPATLEEFEAFEVPAL